MQEIKIKKSYLIIGVIIVLAFGGFFFAQKFTRNSVKETTKSYGSAQDFSLQTTEGETIKLS